MSAVGWTLSVLLALVLLVAGKVLLDLATKEVQGRLDQLPFLILKLARWRLPVELRQAVHDEWWLPDLHYLIARDADRPITRLVQGVRFAVSQVIHAGQTAREVGVPTVRTRMVRVVRALRAETKRDPARPDFHSAAALMVMVSTPITMRQELGPVATLSITVALWFSSSLRWGGGTGVGGSVWPCRLGVTTVEAGLVTRNSAVTPVRETGRPPGAKRG